MCLYILDVCLPVFLLNLCIFLIFSWWLMFQFLVSTSANFNTLLLLLPLCSILFLLLAVDLLFFNILYQSVNYFLYSILIKFCIFHLNMFMGLCCMCFAVAVAFPISNLFSLYLSFKVK